MLSLATGFCGVTQPMKNELFSNKREFRFEPIVLCLPRVIRQANQYFTL